MRKKLVVGNWKMNMTRVEAAACVEEMVQELQLRDGVEVGVCPPFTALDTVHHLLRNTRILLGAQDVFWKESGAFTGSISARMLDDVGCDICIVGHSETRGRFGKLEIDAQDTGYFSETDRTVNLKVKALLYHNICPVLCVGETLEEREAGRTDGVIADQLRAALDGVDGAEYMQAVVAYEPVWAIGTGKVCDTPEAERVCGHIRSVLADVFDLESAEAIRVLYGGSVKPDNAKELFAQPNIDGGLVGGASLNAGQFIQIVRSAA